MTEVEMSFPVEAELHANFIKAVEEREQRPAEEVLRQFMREYVARGHSVISTQEHRRRLDAVSFANTETTLESYPLPLEYQEQTLRFAKGEIDFEQLTQWANEAYGDR